MPAELTARQVEVLGQLAIGSTRLSTARKLHLSPRIVDACTREIKLVLASTHRVCLGVRAVSLGYLQPEAVILATRQPSQGWTTPDLRQLAILTGLAGDTPVQTVAECLAISVSTARADLYRLAAENAATNLIHLGALVQALNWLAGGCRVLTLSRRRNWKKSQS